MRAQHSLYKRIFSSERKIGFIFWRTFHLGMSVFFTFLTYYKKEVHFHTSFRQKTILEILFAQFYLRFLCVPTHHINYHLYDNVIFYLFISGFISIQIKDCVLHKVLKIKDFYIFRFCSNIIVSTWGVRGNISTGVIFSGV